MADDIKVTGISETLAYLKEYEKDLYNALRKDLVEKSKPLAQLVGSQFPVSPLSNWHTSGGRRGKSRMPPYIGTKASAGVKPVAGRGSTRGGARGSTILRIQQMDAGGQVYDSAGGSVGGIGTAGGRFVHNLDSKLSTQSRPGKTRSRTLYKGVKDNMELVEQDVQAVIKKVDAHTTKAINANTGR